MLLPKNDLDNQLASFGRPIVTSETCILPAYLNAVESVSLPPFWKNNPSKWFMWCRLLSILSRSHLTKYNYVLVNLDEATLDSIADILRRTEVLKRRLVETFASSRNIALLQEKGKVTSFRCHSFNQVPADWLVEWHFSEWKSE